MKKSLQIALAAFALTNALCSTTFAEGSQYYPTYRDGVTNVYALMKYYKKLLLVTVLNGV